MNTNGLNKTEIKRIHELGVAMESRRADLECALSDFNLAKRELHEETVLPGLEKYNDAREALGDCLRELSERAEELSDEKSENWQGGDRGQAFAEWQQSLEAAAEECERIDPDEYATEDEGEDANDHGVPDVETEPGE